MKYGRMFWKPSVEKFLLAHEERSGKQALSNVADKTKGRVSSCRMFWKETLSNIVQHGVCCKSYVSRKRV
jgi:hypothetical protein